MDSVIPPETQGSNPFVVGVDVVLIVEWDGPRRIVRTFVTGPADGEGVRIFRGDSQTPIVVSRMGTAKSWYGSATSRMGSDIQPRVESAKLYDWEEVVLHLSRQRPYLFSAADRKEIARAARSAMRALQEVIIACEMDAEAS